MPEGVEVDITDDVATVAFVDPATRGVGIGKLLAAGGAGQVKRVSRPRVAYEVHIDIAVAAGLVDESPTYDDGFPDMYWKRPAINKYATEHGVEDPESLPNKQAVIDAIKALPTSPPDDASDASTGTPGAETTPPAAGPSDESFAAGTDTVGDQATTPPKDPDAPDAQE